LAWSYLARDQEDEQLVNLRVVPQTILPDADQHRTFARRLKPLVGRQLPHVTTVRHIDRDQSKTLVVNDYVEGLNLRSLVDTRRQQGRAFSAVETLAIVRLLAEALEGAAALTPHGDLRPAHITIVEDRLFVEALGLAAALPHEEMRRAFLDSPVAGGYLAPEVIAGRRHSSQSDVYALAMTVGELLTGRPPPGEGAGKEEFLRALPPLAQRVVRQALAQRPEERPASPRDLLVELAGTLGDGAAQQEHPVQLASATADDALDGDEEPTQEQFLTARELHSLTVALTNLTANVDVNVDTQIFFPEREPARALHQPHRDNSTADDTQKNDTAPVLAAAARMDRLPGDPSNQKLPSPADTDPTVRAQLSMDEEDMVTQVSHPPQRNGQDESDATVSSPVPPTQGASDQAGEGAVTTERPFAPTFPLVTIEDEITEPSPYRGPPAMDDNGATAPIESNAVRQSPEMDHLLDPKLLRAARRLDRARSSQPPRVLTPPASPAVGPSPAILADHEITKPNQQPLPVHIDEEITEPHPVPQEPSKDLSSVSFDLLVAPDDDEPTKKVEIVPPSLLGNSVGPLQQRIAGGGGQPRPSSRAAEPIEPAELPAVLVDDSLADCLEGPRDPEQQEATYVVPRSKPNRWPKNLADTLPPTWWRWVLLTGLVSGAVIVGSLALLWLSRCGGP
jgi:serine/threonine protein kinase